MSIAERRRHASFEDNRDLIESRWHARWGDRGNELVFIGQNMDKDRYLIDLERCLLTDEEAEDWRHTQWTDEFPQNI